MRRICLLIHRWLALPFGLFFTIACFTGALLLWKGEIASLMGVEATDMPFFRGVTRLHRWLFMAPANPHGGMSVGRLIMGLTAIASTLILLTGIVVWWPRSRRQLWPRLSLHLHEGFRRFIYDSHVSLGIYAVIFLLLMSLTGPVWSFRSYRKGAVALIGGTEQQKPTGHEAHFTGHPAARQTGHAERPATTEGQRPAPAKARPGKRNEGQPPYREERTAGRPTGHSPQRTFIYLHTGKWGGLAGQVVYTLATLIGGCLPLSGYYLWWIRHRRKRLIRP